MRTSLRQYRFPPLMTVSFSSLRPHNQFPSRRSLLSFPSSSCPLAKRTSRACGYDLPPHLRHGATQATTSHSFLFQRRCDLGDLGKMPFSQRLSIILPLHPKTANVYRARASSTDSPSAPARTRFPSVGGVGGEKGGRGGTGGRRWRVSKGLGGGGEGGGGCMRFGCLIIPRCGMGKIFGDGGTRDVYLSVVEDPLEGVSIGRTYLDGNDISCVNTHGGVASCNLITIVGKAFRIRFVSNHTLYTS